MTALVALSRSSLALLVSLFSLGVALSTFLWRVVYDIYFDAPRMLVSVKALEMMGHGHAPQGVYVVNVTNKGKRPMQVTSLWLGLGRPIRSWWRLAFKVMPKAMKAKVFRTGLMMPGLEYAVYNTQVPCRLDVGEQANVYYVRKGVHDKLKDEAMGYRFLYASVGTTLKGKASKPLRLKDDEDPSQPGSRTTPGSVPE